MDKESIKTALEWWEDVRQILTYTNTNHEIAMKTITELLEKESK